MGEPCDDKLWFGSENGGWRCARLVSLTDDGGFGKFPVQNLCVHVCASRLKYGKDLERCLETESFPWMGVGS